MWITHHHPSPGLAHPPNWSSVPTKHQLPIPLSPCPQPPPQKKKLPLTSENIPPKDEEVLCSISTDNWECALGTKTHWFSFILENAGKNPESGSAGCFGAEESIASFSKTPGIPSSLPHGETKGETFSLFSINFLHPHAKLITFGALTKI